MNGSRKILGVDFGERRLGLAIAEGGLAEPLSIIEVSDQASAIEKVTKTCQQEKVEEIVLGVPNGSEKVKNFGRALSKKTGLKITFWDETLTSEEALSKMIEAGRPQEKRRRLDSVSAAIILQEYLDSQL